MRLCSACLLFLTVTGIQGQSTSTLKMDDVVALLEAKMPEAVILSRIAAYGKPVELGTNDLIRLKQAGATEAVLLRLMNPAAAPAPATATPAPAPTPAPAASGSAATDGYSFSEVGVYHKKGGTWTEVLPEVVNWKTGGTLKGLASAGIIKKDVNGHIAGAHSRNSVASPMEFMIYVPEGVAITEYQLIRLRANNDKDYREFRTITGGVFNQKSGAMRDLVPFEGKKVGNRLYSVVLPSTLGAGEYGFVYMGATGGSGNMGSMSLGKMYTFRLLE